MITTFWLHSLCAPPCTLANLCIFVRPGWGINRVYQMANRAPSWARSIPRMENSCGLLSGGGRLTPMICVMTEWCCVDHEEKSKGKERTLPILFQLSGCAKSVSIGSIKNNEPRKCVCIASSSDTEPERHFALCVAIVGRWSSPPYPKPS